METLNYFDQIKCNPPMHVTRLPDTIKQIKEKKEYYTALSAAEEKEGKAAEAKPEDKDKDNKKNSPKKANKAINLNEEEFPSMH
jgi:hypothetical protein